MNSKLSLTAFIDDNHEQDIILNMNHIPSIGSLIIMRNDKFKVTDIVYDADDLGGYIYDINYNPHIYLESVK